MSVRTGVQPRLHTMSAREIDDLVRATREVRTSQGLPAPGTAEALIRYAAEEAKPDFLPGEMERLLADVYADRNKDCVVL